MVLLTLVGFPLLVLPWWLAEGWLPGTKLFGQALPMLVGLMCLTSAEIALRQPLVRALRLARIGEPIRVEVVGSELTFLGGLAAPLTFLPAMMDHSPIMSGLPRRFHARLLDGPSPGESIEFVCTSEMGSDLHLKGARVLGLRNPSDPQDAGLWAMTKDFVQE